MRFYKLTTRSCWAEYKREEGNPPPSFALSKRGRCASGLLPYFAHLVAAMRDVSGSCCSVQHRPQSAVKTSSSRTHHERCDRCSPP